MNSVVMMSRHMQQEATQLLRGLSLLQNWEGIGCEAHVVGSLAMELMLRRRNINVCVYSDAVSVEQSADGIAQLSSSLGIGKVSYENLLHTERQCIIWHVPYRDVSGDDWTFDMVHMVRGSAYDGYFERVAQGVKEKLDSETYGAILMLKNDTPKQDYIPGIYYYRAVLDDGVRTYADLKRWYDTHKVDGMMRWTPGGVV